MKISYYIAIDFDGTLTSRNNFPETGKPNYEVICAIERLVAELKNDGYRVVLILWTCREDAPGDRMYLSEAVKWCEDNLPFKFDYINENPEITFGHKELVRKIVANLYIDDRAYSVNEIKEKFCK